MGVRIEGLLLDLDGTVYDAGRTIPEAPEAIGRLRDAKVPLRFLTNTSRNSRREVLQRLRDHGVPGSLEEMYTASYGAALWLESRGIERAAVLVPNTVLDDFTSAVPVERDPQVVLVGDLGSDWTFDRLNEAFRWLHGGAELVAIHKNPYWRTPDGLTLDAGALVAALEYATGKRAVTIGKPSADFFHTAAQSMGLESQDVVVVGDDLTTDVRGAKTVGATSVLVRTGKYRDEDLVGSQEQPDYVIDSIADLPQLLFS